MFEAIRLPDEIGMQGDAHHERLRCRLPQHFVEVVDDETGKIARIHLARDDHRDVVQFLRIRYRPQRLARARLERHGLIVVAPVQRVRVTGFDEQVGRDRAFRNPRRQPAARRDARFLDDAVAAGFEQLALVGFTHLALAVRVGVAVADDFIAALYARGDDVRAVVVKRRVDERGGRHFEFVEKFQTAPHADAVAIVAPRKVEHVRFGTFRAERRAETGAEIEVLDVERKVHCQPPAARPVILGAPRNGRIRIASVLF